MCVNLIATGDLKNICTENVTGTDTFEKIECGYGIRTRLRIPESGRDPGQCLLSHYKLVGSSC